MIALVTGSSGFVGRHMVRALAGRDYDVIEMDLPDADIFKALPLCQFDLVVHCAYRVGGREAINGSKTNLAYNLALDSALFRWAELTKPGRVLYFSSSAVYPRSYQTKDMPLDLEERMIDSSGNYAVEPDADYGFAKLCGEKLAANYAAGGGVVHVVRPFSGYGSDQSLDYPFPKFVERAKAKKDPFEVWGDPTSKRDWIHIEDVIGCCLAVIDQDYREPLNVCTGRGTAFEDLAKLCMGNAGYQAPIKSIPGAEGVHTRVGDPTKMLKLYQPKISLEEGVRRAFE